MLSDVAWTVHSWTSVKTRSSDIVMECQNYFGFYTISTLITKKESIVPVQAANWQIRRINCANCSALLRRKKLIIGYYHFSYLTCYCFIICFLAVSDASYCAHYVASFLYSVYLLCYSVLLLNVIKLFRLVGKLLHRRGPAAAKLLSMRLLRVSGTASVLLNYVRRERRQC